jgi:DNA-binding FadR family transcriptional regulator
MASEKTKVTEEPLRRIRVSDQVSEYIRVHIATNGLRPGDELPSESELSRRLGVSRPTVREATNALAGIGIINVSSGRTPTVGVVSDTALPQILSHALAIAQIDTLHTLQVRSFIEERSVMLAANNRSSTDAAELRAIGPRLQATVGDLLEFSDLDIAFHKILARASGNPLVKIIVDGIADVALQSSRSGLREIETRAEWEQVLTTHLEIAEAVIDGDAETAQLRMKQHFDEAFERMNRKSVS